MTPKIEKEVVFKLWDGMGVNSGPRILKYVGSRFDTWKEYYELVAEYYGIQGGVQGLISHIINEANEYLSNPDNIPCGGDAIVRMADITDMDGDRMHNPMTMNLWYEGMGSKPFAQFEYDLVNPDGFECVEIPGFPEEDMRYEFIRIYGDVDFDNMTKEQEDKYKEFCFSEGCLHFAIRDVLSKISNKYGIRTNVNVDKIS